MSVKEENSFNEAVIEMVKYNLRPVSSKAIIKGMAFATGVRPSEIKVDIKKALKQELERGALKKVNNLYYTEPMGRELFKKEYNYDVSEEVMHEVESDSDYSFCSAIAMSDEEKPDSDDGARGDVEHEPTTSNKNCNYKNINMENNSKSDGDKGDDKVDKVDGDEEGEANDSDDKGNEENAGEGIDGGDGDD